MTVSVLDPIMVAEGVDKAMSRHGYSDIYERYLSEWQHDPIRLLEIGVQEGRSLRAWERYFSTAEIIGVDIDPGCQEVRHARASIVIGDQRDREFMKSLGKFDVVIDDGSHVWKDQIASFRALFPLMDAGGLYFIEDVQTSYWWKYKSSGPNTVEFFKMLVDDLNNRGRLIWSQIDRCAPSMRGKLRRYQGKIGFIHWYPGMIVIQRAEVKK